MTTVQITISDALAKEAAAEGLLETGAVVETNHGENLGGEQKASGVEQGGGREPYPRQRPPRLPRDADRDRTASPSNQIWNGTGYGQRPVDFSGVSRMCCLVRERTSGVAPTCFV